jgi:hypothetical protein
MPDPIDIISDALGVKWGKPKMPGNRPAGGGATDYGKAAAGALNALGRGARSITQARERAMSPKPAVAKSRPVRKASGAAAGAAYRKRTVPKGGHPLPPKPKATYKRGK